MSSPGAASTPLPASRLPAVTRHALAAAGLCIGALFTCWYLAFHSVTVARADAHAYFAFAAVGADHARITALARWITGLCQPFPFVVLAAVPVTVALLRRRWALALALSVILPAAPISCDLLKPLMAAPRPAVGVPATLLSGQSSWPSGHSCAAMVLALSLVVATPARGRPLVALVGSVFALAVVYSLLCLGWHYPSDALGGMLVALCWTLAAVAAVSCVDARYGRSLAQLTERPHPWLDQLPSVAVMLLAGALPAMLVLLWRGHAAGAYVARHTAFVAAALGLAAAATVLPRVLTLALSGSDRAARAAQPRH